MPSSPVTASTMHPISISLLQQQQFYSAASTASPGSSSSSTPSPLKRSRDHVMSEAAQSVNATTTGWSSAASAAGSDLPSPGQMSVDSMSPPPPSNGSTGASSALHGASHLVSNGGSHHHMPHGQQHQLPASVLSSSNGGYSPSPMSTGSYDGLGPYSPATGLSKLGKCPIFSPFFLLFLVVATFCLLFCLFVVGWLDVDLRVRDSRQLTMQVFNLGRFISLAYSKRKKKKKRKRLRA